MKSPISVSSSAFLLTPSGAKKTDSNEQFLAVHYMHLCRIRHWVSQEVYLDPNLVIIKVYAAIANIGVDFIPSSYPTAEIFNGIPLPAAFIDGQPSATRGIIQYLQTIVNIDKEIRTSFGEERQALEIGASNILADAISFALYGHSECFTKFTTPILRDSLPRIFVNSYLASKRTQNVNKDKDLLSQQLWRLIKDVSRKLGWVSGKKFLFDDDRPSLCDITIYAYFSVLLSIPENLIVFQFLKHDQPVEIDETIQRIKSYLLDFDDWLWQLNTKRSDESAGLIPLIPSAAVAAKGAGGDNMVNQEQVPEEDSHLEDRPFLGRETDIRKSNSLFLACAALSMLAIGLLI